MQEWRCSTWRVGWEALPLFEQAKTLAPAEQQAAIDALIAQAGG